MTALGANLREQMQNARLATLHAMSVENLKALWDRYPDDGSTIVDGIDLDDVHFVLNMKGCGDYCRV